VEAYQTNLDVVLKEVDELLTSATGKTVVTADHGELLGERMSPVPVRRYSHPRGVFVDTLLTVPWFIHEDGTRKEIVSSPPETDTELDEETVDAQLKALGYKI